MKVYVVIQGEEMVCHSIDRFKVCKTKKKAEEVVKEYMSDGGIWIEKDKAGKKVWVAEEPDSASSDSMIYIREMDLEE